MPPLASNWAPLGEAAARIVVHTAVAALLRRLCYTLGATLPQAFALLDQAVADFDLDELIQREGDEPTSPSPPPYAVR
jgi:hypothetical protein